MLPDSRSLHHIMRRKKKSRERIKDINRQSILLGYTNIPKPKRGRLKNHHEGFDTHG